MVAQGSACRFDDLLNVSRISTGRLELRRMPVDLVAMAHDAVDNLRPTLDRAGHALTLDLPGSPLYVDGDPVRLVQMFSNLLNNASKYTDPPGQILLKVDTEGGDARVLVKDNGIGIAAGHLTKIFEMFSQLDHSLTRGQGGLGIGLSLVRSLVELHGGQVVAHSDGEGKGSEFTIRLPVIPAPQVPLSGAPPARAPGDVRNHRILVVDDNEETALSLAMLLHMEGHLTAVAHSGPEAMQVGAKFEPQCVLLDIGMPGENGFDIARKIREQPWGASLALFAITGYGQESDKLKSKRAGFDRHFVKPVDHVQLTEALVDHSTRSAPS
nr:ATP-binding protein [Panacagrimonas sp.]